QAEDGIRYWSVTGVQTCALPISTLNVSLAADRFAVGNFRGVELDVDAVALFQAADDDFDVLLTASGEQKFLRLRVAIEAQRFVRSEERRVGKEGRTGVSPYH